MNVTATIQKVRNVKHYLNTDNLDAIDILGNEVITYRDEFKINDLCVLINIQYVCKCFPLSILPHYNPDNYGDKMFSHYNTDGLLGVKVEEGLDVTEDLLPNFDMFYLYDYKVLLQNKYVNTFIKN